MTAVVLGAAVALVVGDALRRPLGSRWRVPSAPVTTVR